MTVTSRAMCLQVRKCQPLPGWVLPHGRQRKPVATVRREILLLFKVPSLVWVLFCFVLGFLVFGGVFFVINKAVIAN